MKNPFRYFFGGALFALVLVFTMGQSLDIQNPAAQGLTRQTPYMSLFGQQWLTNASPGQALTMLVGGTNFTGAFITNGQAGVNLSGTFNSSTATNLNSPTNVFSSSAIGNLAPSAWFGQGGGSAGLNGTGGAGATNFLGGGGQAPGSGGTGGNGGATYLGQPGSGSSANGLWGPTYLGDLIDNAGMAFPSAQGVLLGGTLSFTNSSGTTILSLNPNNSITAGPITATSFAGDGHLLTGLPPVSAAATAGVATNALNANNVPAQQFTGPAPGLKNYSSLPGLAALWEPEQYTILNYTNGQQLPTLTTDLVAGLTLSNYTGIATYNAGGLNGNPGINLTNGAILACTNLATPGMLTNCTFSVAFKDLAQDNGNRMFLCFGPQSGSGNPNFFVQSYVVSGFPVANAAGAIRILTTNNNFGAVYALPSGHSAIDVLTVRITPAGGLPNQINVKVWHNGYVAYDNTLQAGGAGGANIPIVGGDGMTNTFFVGGTPSPAAQTPCNVILGDMPWYTNGLTDDQCRFLNQIQMTTYYGNCPSPDFIFDGASWETGAGTIQGSNYQQQAYWPLAGYNIQTTAVGGCGSGTAYTNMLGWIKTKHAPGSIVFLGSDVAYNDLVNLHLNANMSTFEAFVTNYAAVCHTNGCKFILGGTISAQIWETNTALSRAVLTAWERSNWTNFADGFADFSVDSYLTNGGYSNNLAYPAGDFTHPGNIVYASMLKNELIPAIQYAQNNGSFSVSNLTALTANINGQINFNSNNVQTLVVYNGRSLLDVDTNYFSSDGQKDLFFGAGNLPNFATYVGVNNIGIGFNAFGLASSSVAASGGNNIAIGQSSLANLAAGTFNIGIGFGALNQQTSAQGNIAIGFQANDNNNDNNNVVIGMQAMHGNYTGGGGGNIAIGFQAGANMSSAQNDIDIGNNGSANTTETGAIRIGTPGTHTQAYIAGQLNSNGGGLTNVPLTILDTFGFSPPSTDPVIVTGGSTICYLSLQGAYHINSSQLTQSGLYSAGNATVFGTINSSAPNFSPTTNLVWWAFTNNPNVNGPGGSYTACAHGFAVQVPYTGSTCSNFVAQWTQVAPSYTIFALSNTAAGNTVTLTMGMHGYITAPLQQ